MKSIDVHQANVTGLGAEKFAAGLIKHLLGFSKISIKTVYISSFISASQYGPDTKITFVDYFLGGLSRLFEICFWRLYRRQNNELLVLGDLPVNTRAKQYVLCHQSLMFKQYPIFTLLFFKFSLFRFLFRLFLKKGDVVIVQTKEMAKNVRSIVRKGVEVEVLDLNSNFFGWPEFSRQGRRNLSKDCEVFELVYPAAFYPHKNHFLLDMIDITNSFKIFLTIEEHQVGKAEKEIECIGRVSRDEIFELYRRVDALLFLSSNESLGMPILEAVKCNLPIICPYAEYTKELDSENCFFFDIQNPSSLLCAIDLAKRKILEGWWPDWDFDAVATNAKSVAVEDIILR